MPIFFRVLSAAYIAGIFLFADSPVVDDVAAFNPSSLLHIPLYGILTLLLILSFPRRQRRVVNSTDSTDSTNLSNPINLFVSGIIALVVAISDEVHQAYLPTRNASVIDVLLDFVGIICCIVFALRIRRKSGLLKRLSVFSK